jgi:hypothetical protein
MTMRELVSQALVRANDGSYVTQPMPELQASAERLFMEGYNKRASMEEMIKLLELPPDKERVLREWLRSNL